MLLRFNYIVVVILTGIYSIIVVRTCELIHYEMINIKKENYTANFKTDVCNLNTI